MTKYIPTEKTPKHDWKRADEAARLESLGTPESLARAARLRQSDQIQYQMGGFGRWIAKKESESK